MNLALGTGLMLLMVIIELIILKFYKKEQIPWKDVVFNLNSGHILMWILRGAELAVFYFILHNYSFYLLESWSLVPIWIFTFLTWDFCFYWLHRLHHKIKLFWMVHVVHHEGEEFNLSLGIRNSWYSSVTSIPFFVILAFIGVPFEIFVTISSLHYFIQFYNHNGLVKNSGFLEKIMITPSHHKVHHGVNDDYIDKNFGGTLVIWDKMFGTFQIEKEDDPVILGTLNHVKTSNLFWANNIPLLKLLGKATPKFKEKDVRYKVKGFVLGMAALILFMLLLSYIFYENVWTNDIKIFLFVIVFVGTLAIGGISEGRYWGLILWGITGVVMPIVFMVTTLNYLLLNVCFALLLLHVIYTSFIALTNKNNLSI